MNTIVREASSDQDVDAFAKLIDEYVLWLRSSPQRALAGDLPRHRRGAQ